MTITRPSDPTTDQVSCCQDRSTFGRLAVNVPTAAGVSLAIWAGARLAGVDLAVRQAGGTSTVGWPSVLVASVVATTLGTLAVAFLLGRRRGDMIAFWLVTVTFLLSLVLGPLNARMPTAAFVLGTMHAAVWGVLVGPLRRRRLNTGRG
jgi:hypothetical protein